MAKIKVNGYECANGHHFTRCVERYYSDTGYEYTCPICGHGYIEDAEYEMEEEKYLQEQEQNEIQDMWDYYHRRW